MANETTLTLIGNLTADPELKYTPSGAAVTSFTVASTPRLFDKQTNGYKDGDTLFLRCNVWREQAEHCAESLQRGMRVIVQGRLKQRSYETREGEKRTVYEVEADEVGPSLKNATAKVEKAQRSGGGFGHDTPPAGRQGQQDTYGGQGRGGRQPTPPADDPWATSGQQAGTADDPPF